MVVYIKLDRETGECPAGIISPFIQYSINISQQRSTRIRYQEIQTRSWRRYSPLCWNISICLSRDSCELATIYCTKLQEDILTSWSQLCRELRQENIVGLEEVLLEDKAIYMVFEYAEHDFLVNSIFTDRNLITHLLICVPLANYTPSFTYRTETDTRSRCQVISMAIAEWSGLFACQLGITSWSEASKR